MEAQTFDEGRQHGREAPSGLREPGLGSDALRDALALPPPSAKSRRGDSRGYMLRRLLLLADLLALSSAFVLLETLGGFDGGAGATLTADLILFAFALPLWTLLAQIHNLYHVDSRRADHGAVEELAPIVQMTTLWSWSVLLAVSATGLREVSIGNLALFWVLATVFLLVFRSGARQWAKARPWYVQNALAVGPVPETLPVLERILRHPEYGINVVASIDPSDTEIGGGLTDAHVAGGLVPAIRGEADVVELVNELGIDRVILTSSGTPHEERDELLYGLSELDVHIDLVPSWSDVAGGQLDLHELEGVPLLTVPKMTLSRSARACKRALDLTAGLLALAVLAPLFALVAIGIKVTSPGPVFYRQSRVGKDDCRFELWKFRTMYRGADARKQDVARLNFHGGGNADGMFKIRHDPRVTPIGRLLRRTSIDELPQLVNVVRGEMSLVGPRPLIENEARQVEGHYRRRLSITPGLTGLWQVNGRSNIPFDQMVNLDYLYVTGWSLWRDIKLLIRTIGVVVKGDGAY